MDTRLIHRAPRWGFLLWLAACGVSAPSSSVLDPAATQSTVRKFDFLWVIDHSSSMAKHQRALGAGIGNFVAALKAKGEIDVQMAVVTVQQIPDLPNATGVTVKDIGAFNTTAATAFPPNAIAHYRAPCFVDGAADPTAPSAQCHDGFDYAFTQGKNWQAPATSLLKSAVGDPPGQPTAPPYGDVVKHYAPNLPGTDTSPINEWRCVQPTAANEVTNSNGSVNSYCQRHCTTDKECQDVFAEPSMICYTPGGPSGDSTTSGCMLPPATKNCPAPHDNTGAACETDATCPSLNHCVDHGGVKSCTPYLPAVIDSHHMGLFHCIATVGVSSSQQSTVEGGMRSAWLALDPAGPHCQDAANCQNLQLIREGATLVIVFLSDDDDCSMAPNVYAYGDLPFYRGLFPSDQWGLCQLLGDAAGDNAALNEGNCLYIKAKQAAPDAYKCPSDCDAQDTSCLAQAAKNVEANKAVDSRFGTVADYAAQFASLKEKPQQLIIAAITGDSPDAEFVGGKQPPASAQVRTDRAVYNRAVREAGYAHRSPYICGSAFSESGYGSRYLQLAASFGDNGWAANLCADDLGATLTDLATFLANHP